MTENSSVAVHWGNPLPKQKDPPPRGTLSKESNPLRNYLVFQYDLYKEKWMHFGQFSADILNQKVAYYSYG